MVAFSNRWLGGAQAQGGSPEGRATLIWGKKSTKDLAALFTKT
jgi:hypothetical protein